MPVNPCISQYDLYRRLRLQFLVVLIMGAVTPETCRVTLQWNKSDCILLNLVGLLFNVNYDARNHELRRRCVYLKNCNYVTHLNFNFFFTYVTWPWQRIAMVVVQPPFQNSFRSHFVCCGGIWLNCDGRAVLLWPQMLHGTQALICATEERNSCILVNYWKLIWSDTI